MSAGPGQRLHTIWKGIKSRCQSPSSTGYDRYGGRGIALCEEWQTFVGFLDWALASGYSQDRTIDRIDADGPYEPGNCRWVSAALNNSRRELARDGRYLSTLAGKLTDEAVQKAAGRGKSYKLSDGNGLHLFVSSTGRKTFRFRYKRMGADLTLALGSYPGLSLREAREHAAIARARLARGADPAAIRRESAARRDRYRSKSTGSESG